MSTLHRLHSTLEHLSGMNVRVTIATNEDKPFTKWCDEQDKKAAPLPSPAVEKADCGDCGVDLERCECDPMADEKAASPAPAPGRRRPDLATLALAVITACSDTEAPLPGYDANGEPTVNHEGRGAQRL